MLAVFLAVVYFPSCLLTKSYRCSKISRLWIRCSGDTLLAIKRRQVDNAAAQSDLDWWLCFALLSFWQIKRVWQVKTLLSQMHANRIKLDLGEGSWPGLSFLFAAEKTNDQMHSSCCKQIPDMASSELNLFNRIISFQIQLCVYWITSLQNR